MHLAPATTPPVYVYRGARMRPLARGIVFVVFALAPISAAAQEKGSIEGFGGLSLNGLTSESPISLGGAATVSLTPNIQIVGEAGRLANVMPILSNAVFSAARLDL